MGKIKYDLRGVEAGGNFETIPRGVYHAKVSEVEETQSKSSGNDMLAITLTIARGDYSGRLLWDYIVLNEQSEWKLKQFLTAVGTIANGSGEKGAFDPADLVGRTIQVNVKHETDDQFGTRAKVGSMMPLPEGVTLDEDEDELEDEEEPDEEEDGELTYADLQSYDRATLKQVIKENELGIRVTKSKTDDALRDQIAEELELEVDEDDEEEEADYDSMSVADLKAAAKERGLSAAGTKKTLVKRLQAADEDEGDDTEPF